MTMRKRAPTFCILSVIAAFAAQAGGTAFAGTYRWVDENGRVHYSDQMPASEKNRAYSVINPQGITVKSVEKTKTPEQLAEEQRRMAQAEEAARLAREHALHDRILLDTYPSDQHLIETRDRHIATIEGLIDVSQHKLSNLNEEQQKLTKSAAHLERQGNPVPDELRDDIKAVQTQTERELSFIRSQRAQQTQIREKFAADLARYKELKAAQQAQQ